MVVAKPKDLISKEITRVTGLLRDLLSDQFDQILVDHPGMAEQLREYVQGIAPDKVNLVQYYKGKVPLFEHIGLDKQIKGSFGTSVSLPGGRDDRNSASDRPCCPGRRVPRPCRRQTGLEPFAEAL